MAAFAGASVKRMARHLFKMTRELAPRERREVNETIKDHFRTNKMADSAQRLVGARLVARTLHNNDVWR